jgi:hypothetical protein
VEGIVGIGQSLVLICPLWKILNVLVEQIGWRPDFRHVLENERCVPDVREVERVLDAQVLNCQTQEQVTARGFRYSIPRISDLKAPGTSGRARR